jgi:16S rRNA G966 N2-methylase RsmD
VVARDVRSYLQDRRPDGSEGSEPDLVFVDPPYDADGSALERVLESLGRSWLAAPEWTVVLTRGHKGPLPAVPVDWAARRQLRYGDSLVILYQPRSSQEVGWA